MDLHDVKIIESIPLSRTHTADRDGWHFTNNGKYRVKSGYQVERVDPDGEKSPVVFGSTVDLLKAFCWKIRYPPKLKYFLWQLVSDCIAVRKNLRAREMQRDLCCVRCGVSEESINHVFFECPPVRQVCALLKIPSNPAIFPTSSLFTNMDHFFGEFLHNKVFSNLDIDPWKH